MEMYMRHGTGRTDSGARLCNLKPEGEHHLGETAYRSVSSPSAHADRYIGLSRKGSKCTYGDARGPTRPTSPAFLRLLAQRSPSHSSCSPSVMSRLSSRRRVSSPIVACGWRSPHGGPVPKGYTASRQTSNGSLDEALSSRNYQDAASVDRGYHGASEENCITENCASRKPRRSMSRDSNNGNRERSSSRKISKSHKKRTEGIKRSQSPRGQNNADLHAMGRSSSCGFVSSSRPQGRRVMSPRQFPPPTFEKILLGIADTDFTLEDKAEEPDEFERSPVKPRENMTRGEEECGSVELREHSGDQVSTSSPTTSRASPESCLEDFSASHRDGLIPEHYLYIPPLRLGASRDEKRPVPGLQQAAEDDDEQISVRGERRHIATLFSLEAAESHAQKTRLEEQLKATSPFRLAEMGDISASVGGGLEGPPGKQKRRHRSKVLETIVRQHDWEAPDPDVEEMQMHQSQQRVQQESPPRAPKGDRDSPFQGVALKEKEQRGHPSQGSSMDSNSAKSEFEVNQAHEAKTEGLSTAVNAMSDWRTRAGDVSAAAAVAAVAAADAAAETQEWSQDGSAEDEPADIPGAFDAIWRRCYGPGENRNRNDMSSKATHSDSESPQDDIFRAMGDVARRNNLTEFLGVAPMLSEGADDTLPSSNATAAAGSPSVSASVDCVSPSANNLFPSVDARKTPERPTLSGPGAIADVEMRGMSLLRLGDPADWEVRYSTENEFPSSAEQSPIHTNNKDLAETEEEGEREWGKQEDVGAGKGEEQDPRDLSGNAPSELLPGEPPEAVLPASGRREVSGDPSMMSTYSNGRLLPGDQYSSVGCHGRALAADSAQQVTTEPCLAAAMDLRLVSFQEEEAETRRSQHRRVTTQTTSDPRSASRKRQRTFQNDRAEATCEGSSVASDKRGNGGLMGGRQRSYSMLDSTTSTLHGDAEYNSYVESRKAEWKQRPSFVAAAAAAAAETGRAGQEAVCDQADAWHGGRSLALHAENVGGADGNASVTDFLCDIDLSEPLRVTDRASPSRSPPPNLSRSMEVCQAISRATFGCTYGPGVHVILVGSMLVAVWALLSVCYLFAEGRGVRFFASCAVALSFVVAFCLGTIYTNLFLFKWRALKYAIDFDMRELLFSSLKRLRPAADARDPSIEGMGERGRQLRLACNCFVELITEGSPKLHVSCTVERRFLIANIVVGLVAAGLIALLQFADRRAPSKTLRDISPGEAIATGAAVLYSAFLLVLSYWLATPPSPSVVQRSVEMHTVFQCVWALTFVDVLVDKRAVTAKSAEDIRLPPMEEMPHSSSPCVLPLRYSPFKKNQGMSMICIRGTPGALRSSFMTARIVWQLPGKASFKILKGFRVGQRVLLTLTTAPLRGENLSKTQRAQLYLNLIWCDSQAMPKELQIPIDFNSLDCEFTACGCMPSRLRSLVRGQQAAGSGNVAALTEPLEVLRLLLGLLQGDPTDSFLGSQTRRYLSEQGALSPASCEFPLILRVSVDALSCGACSACGLRVPGCRGVCGPCSKSPPLQRGSSIKPADVEVCSQGLVSDKVDASRVSTSGLRVGPWTVQNPYVPWASPRRSVQLHTDTSKRVGVSTASRTSAVPKKYSHAGDSGGSAYLTLLFSSEEQREEFNGCLEKVLCT